MGRRRARGVARSGNPFDQLDGHPVAELDLHGFGAGDAESALRRFLEGARREHPGGLVCVITGRGAHSPGAPVLLGRVRGWLSAHRFPQVAEWGTHDSEGAYLIRLRGGQG